jgi:hypothetical protein
MRNLFAVGIVAMAALVASPAVSADYPTFPQYPEYPTIDIPELPPVDYGLGGSFYLRGSISGDIWHAIDGNYCACVASFSSPGWGLGGGIGAGYETGEGKRFDVTLDYLHINGLTATSGHTINLRSGLLLANAYYDFNFGGSGLKADGGFGAYVGAGFGAAKNYSEVSNGAWGTSLEAAGAIMAGVTYDMGSVVADLGYRGIYMNKVMDQPAGGNTYIINHNFIHELRATVRYRFN